jgi:hypothetical protein
VTLGVVKDGSGEAFTEITLIHGEKQLGRGRSEVDDAEAGHSERE